MPDSPITRWADADPILAVPGLIRRTLGYTADAMLVEFRAEAGVDLPLHSHPHQQVGYVVSGELHLTIAETAYICHPGDSYAIPGGVPHRAHFPIASIVIDGFTPRREDYL